MENTYIYLLQFVLVLHANFIGTWTKSLPNGERECDLLLNRLKRDTTTNFIDDDDAFIENLIKSTLNQEKQKCIDKYHLSESGRRLHQEDVDEAKTLRDEVAKLKDLVNIIKDQRYILSTLEKPSLKKSNLNPQENNQDHVHELIKAKELENLREELKTLQHEIQQSTPLSPKTKPTSENFPKANENIYKEKLDKQQHEISNLKHLLQGVLVEMQAGRKQISTTTESTKTTDKMTQMLQDLSKMEKKLKDIEHQQKSTPGNEVVGMGSPIIQMPPHGFQNSSLLRQSQERSSASVERASEQELDALLSILAPEKTSSSVETLLKSLDSDSDDELERRLLSLEKQMKRKKKEQIETKLKTLEKQLSHSTSVQSKSDDLDIGENAQLKRLLVKMIKKKNKDIESKSLDDDELLDELKSLQKSIKSLNTDDDDLFDDIEEKNANLDVTIEKLINAGGNGGNISKKRKLSQAQIKALRRRIMAMKHGNTGHESIDNTDEEGDSNYAYGHGNGLYEPTWHVSSLGTGGYGGGHGDPSFYGSDGNGHDTRPYNQESGSNHGAFKYGNSFGNVENFYGNPGSYGSIPTNQFGSPLYSAYSNYPGFLPYSGYPNNAPYSSVANVGHAGSYTPSKYVNSNPSYSTKPLSPPGVTSYQSANTASYKQFFPASNDVFENSYKMQSNPGTPSTGHGYQNQPTANAMGPVSVTDLKHQIYELQGVINTFNRPEYVQKPEDKAMVYNLNQQINELKAVVNTLQDGSHAGTQNAPNSAYEQPQPISVVEPIPTKPYVAPEPEVPQPAPPPAQPLQPVGYNSPASSPPLPGVQTYAAPQHAPAQRSYQNYRSRRNVDIHSAIHQNQDTLNTLGLILGEVLGFDFDEINLNKHYESKLREASEAKPNRVFEDINEKIADVRKQLDYQMNGHRPKLLFPQLHQPTIPYLPQPVQQAQPLPNQRNSNNAEAYYTDYNNNYSEEKNTKRFKLKKEGKKDDIFDIVLEKILTKVIDKLKKAFPTILEVIFGSLGFSKETYGEGNAYENGYGNGYETQKYDGGNYDETSLIKEFHGMGLFGILPMLLAFLVPVLVLMLAAGGIIFLIWWMQPEDDHDYKQDTYPIYRSREVISNKLANIPEYHDNSPVQSYAVLPRESPHWETTNSLNTNVLPYNDKLQIVYPNYNVKNIDSRYVIHNK